MIQMLNKILTAIILVAIMMIFPMLLVVAYYNNWDNSITTALVILNVVGALIMSSLSVEE